ncbi:hypothetical protein DL93DRAFT_2091162 [Clavulina sp. PMI_390]|nr:hypothetical protein DL93DRAFT_2091162 [Clavulina sp. PMI_390]
MEGGRSSPLLQPLPPLRIAPLEPPVRGCTGEEGPEPEPDATVVLPVLIVQRDVDAPDAVEREIVWYRGV